ncbi:MAG: ABC transporter permease [Gemmatimonadetes bacterium]|nr:ABC transporter permease [Gemmatimonadota bacterium]
MQRWPPAPPRPSAHCESTYGDSPPGRPLRPSRPPPLAGLHHRRDSHLALGIGVNSAIFGVVNAVLYRPLPVDRPEQLVNIYGHQATSTKHETTSVPNFVDYERQVTTLSGLAGYTNFLGHATIDGASDLVLGELVTERYFSVLGVRPMLGRAFTAEENAAGHGLPVAILSYRLWQRRFGGDRAVLGRQFRMNGELFTVVGVAPENFGGMVPAVTAQMWLPAAMAEVVEPVGNNRTSGPIGPGPRAEQRGEHWLWVRGRMKPGETLTQVRAELETVSARRGRRGGPQDGGGVPRHRSRPGLHGCGDVARPGQCAPLPRPCRGRDHRELWRAGALGGGDRPLRSDRLLGEPARKGDRDPQGVRRGNAAGHRDGHGTGCCWSRSVGRSGWCWPRWRVAPCRRCCSWARSTPRASARRSPSWRRWRRLPTASRRGARHEWMRRRRCARSEAPAGARVRRAAARGRAACRTPSELRRAGATVH